MRVLIDTNVWLDVSLRRVAHAENSRKVIEWCEQSGEVEATLVAFHTMTNLYYVLRAQWKKQLLDKMIKNRGLDLKPADKTGRSALQTTIDEASLEADRQAKQLLAALAQWVHLAPSGMNQIAEACGTPTDLEDYLQGICARDGGADYLVTRDKTFHCEVPVISTDEFVARIIIPWEKAGEVKEMIDQAIAHDVIRQKGGWYIFAGEDLTLGQGRRNAEANLLEDDDLRLRISKAIRAR